MNVYEVDFLPVENNDQDGGKSGDAIAMRFSVEAEGRNAVVVIDGGRAYTGPELVEHIQTHYKTDKVDLVISTHPDADHLNGLATVLEECTVGELLVHQPRLHTRDVSEFSNLEALDELLKIASARGVAVTEPFAGLTRFNGQLEILGPTEGYYVDLLGQQLAPAAPTSAAASIARSISGVLNKVLSLLPVETLTNDGETSPRNNSSVITLVRVGGRRLLFTGDAGITALDAAADRYEETVGAFISWPLHLMQAPHHGSRRNLGPAILDRILGRAGASYSPTCSAAISSALASAKHPSPKIVNALSRRGCKVNATEGKTICYGDTSRPGWVPLAPLPPLVEDDGDD